MYRRFLRSSHYLIAIDILINILKSTFVLTGIVMNMNISLPQLKFPMKHNRLVQVLQVEAVLLCGVQRDN